MEWLVLATATVSIVLSVASIVRSMTAEKSYGKERGDNPYSSYPYSYYEIRKGRAKVLWFLNTVAVMIFSFVIFSFRDNTTTILAVSCTAVFYAFALTTIIYAARPVWNLVKSAHDFPKNSSLWFKAVFRWLTD
jgi:hypothetical protein